MPEVGVLNLSVKTETTEAEKSLTKIANALSRVQEAVSNGFKLSDIGQEIVNFTSNINGAKGASTTIKNLGTLFNAISKFSKIKNLHIDTQPFKDIKDAVGDGIKIETVGTQLNALRSAMSGDWGDGTGIQTMKDLHEVVASFKGGDASQISNLAKSVNQYAGSIKNMNKASQGTSDWRMAMGGREIENAEALEAAENYMVFNNEAERLNIVITSLKQQLGEGILGGTMDEAKMAKLASRISSLSDKYTKLTAASTSVTEGTEAIQTGFEDTAGVVDEMCQQMDQSLAGVKENVGEIIPELKKAYEGGRFHPSMYGPKTSGTNAETVVNLSNQKYEDILKLQDAEDRVVLTAEEKLEQIRRMFGNASDEVKKKIAEIYNIDPGVFNDFVVKMEQTASVVETVSQAASAQTNIRDYGGEMVENMAANYSEIDLLTMKMNGMQQALADDINLNRVDTQQIADRMMTIHRLQDKIEALRKAQEDLNDSTKSGQSAWKTLGSNLKKMFPFLSKIENQFGRIIMRRALTAVIRSIASGFKEGVENVYEYSKAIGSSFAPSMDAAASSILQMKNSLGAAIAPAIQALIPVLQTVVSWFITLVNYANQFLALLGGQSTWTRALPATATAFGKQEKAARGAGAAIKDLLADWDELNIIQSESGGGGGGGAAQAAEDYLSMFEEVKKFDSKIREIVDFIKDNFEQLKTIAFDIGAALLAWKVSSVFSGFIATLAGIVASGLIAKLVFDVSTLFTNEYFKTGDIGWLVKDLLTTFVGGFFTKAILDKVLGGGIGDIAIPLTFGLSAAATIKAEIENTDVDALSEKGLLASLTAALEGGVAAGYLAHLVGATLGDSLRGGVVGAIATFGIAVGLKADAQVAADGITPGNVKAKLLGIGSLGIAGAAAGAKLGAKYGVGALVGATGMSMLFMGIPVATFGVAVGLNAINETVDAGGITPEVIRDNLIAAGTVGVGLAISAAAIVGGTIGTIVGAAGAVLTLGVLFGLEAILTSENTTVQWGNLEATKEQVRAFVDEEIFSASPKKVMLDLANASLEPIGESKAKLEGAAATVLGTLHSVRLGLVESSGTDLQGELQTFIDTFNETSEKYQEALRVSVSLIPVSSEEDNGESIVKNSESRWNELNGIMQNLANDLTKEFDTAYNSNLDEMTRRNAEESVKKISNMMAQIADAVSAGQAQAKVAHSLNEQIGNLTQGAMDDMISYYQEQRETLIAQLVTQGSDAAEGILAQYYSFKKLAEYALKDAKGNVNDETYRHYAEQAESAHAEYLRRMENMDKDAKRAADEALKDTEGVRQMRDALLGKITTAFQTDAEQIFESGGISDADKYRNYIRGLLSGIADETTDDSLLQDELGKILWTNLYDVVGGKNVDTYQNAIKNGIIGYGDVLGADFGQILTDALNIGNESDEIKTVWANLINQLFPDQPVVFSEKPDEVIDDAAAEAQRIREELLKKIAGRLPEEASKIFESAGAGDADLYKNYITGLLMEFSSGMTDGSELKNEINKIIYGNLHDVVGGENVNKYLDAINSGLITYQDVLGEDFAKILTDTFDIGSKDPEIQDAWETIISNLFPKEPIKVGNELLPDIESIKEDKKALGDLMTQLFPDSNVDFLNRPILDFGDYYETLFTNTLTAGTNEYAEIPWNADIVMNLTPILPDGTKLTGNELQEYVRGLLGESSNISELFMNDSVENGGKGLLINVLDEFDSLDDGIKQAVELAKKLHELQELYYGTSPNSSSSGNANFFAAAADVSGRYDPSRLVASGGFADVGFSGRRFVSSPNGTTPEQPDLSAEVEAGTRSANTDQNIILNNQSSLLNQLISLCQQIARKDFTVNINPSSGWGMFTDNSMSAKNRITGESV